MTESDRIRLPVPQESVIFLIHKNNQFLIETVTKPGSGYFGHNRIPGGKIETFELPAQAVFREVFEEFGLICKKITYLDTFEDATLNNNLVRIHAFLVKDFSGQVKQSPKEAKKGFPAWIDRNITKECLSLASSRLVLKLAEEELPW